MSLNKQLLCVSLLLLCLPWAGCQYLQEIDKLLRNNQQQALMASTRAIAAALSQQPAPYFPNQQLYWPNDKESEPLYFSPLTQPLWVDGYDDGWESIPTRVFSNPDKPAQNIRYRSAIYQQQLFLFFEISDQNLQYNNPSISLIDSGDRLVLTTEDREFTFTTSAPGPVNARYLDDKNRIKQEASIKAHWQDTEQGYNLEISLPIQLSGHRLGFYVWDESDSSTDRYGPLIVKGAAVPAAPIVYQTEALAEWLAGFAQPGHRLSVVDSLGWPLAQQGELVTSTPPSRQWLIRKFYRAVLSAQTKNYPVYPAALNLLARAEIRQALTGKIHSHWYRLNEYSDMAITASAAPIIFEGKVVAAIISENSSEQMAALSDQAFSRLLLLSLAAITLVSIGLLGYASWLSWRIRRLNRAASNAVSDDGKISDGYQLPSGRSRDEIGTLSRGYTKLLGRVKDYNDYLQTLSRKLSHELRTPLAIIHSSLDNLEQAEASQRPTYQQRAKEGALRLGNILTAMSEASRVEASIEQAEKEPVNIVQLLTELSQAYSDSYQQHRIRFRQPDESEVIVKAAPDLLVQMLDKLIDNAASFAPPNGLIELSMALEKDQLTIAVENEGPLLPATMQGQLFDNMVSMREKKTDAVHLGLGLHIVQLIVKFHQGSIAAANRDDGEGVIFTAVFPL